MKYSMYAAVATPTTSITTASTAPNAMQHSPPDAARHSPSSGAPLPLSCRPGSMQRGTQERRHDVGYVVQAP